MTIILSPEHERLLAQALQTGAYSNPDEVISRALEMLNSEEQWLHEQSHEINAKIERAFTQFERGEFLSDEEARADMQRRKDSWLSDRRRS